MSSILGFTVKGLFGSRDIDLRFNNGVLVLVGPNGAGKSTVVNIFYFFVTRQWDRLLEHDFQSISLVLTASELSATRDEIFSLQRWGRALSELGSGTRPARLVARLRELGLLEEFLASGGLGAGGRKRFADALRVPTTEVLHLYQYLTRRLPESEGEFGGKKTSPELEKSLSDVIPGRVLYLPTYRRIEKDLTDIFPALEDQMRRYGLLSPGGVGMAARSSAHFVDLVSFGMNDVQETIKRRLGGMRDYSLAKHNDLSATYLRDVIRGEGDSFKAKDIKGLTDQRVRQILDRVDEGALPKKDKQLLLTKVNEIQGRKRAELSVHDKFLAHYFTRLVAVNAEIGERETDITSFVSVCNEYLSPSKRMVYDELKFSLRIEDDAGKEIALSALSSGEKQIVSVFSHLYLDEHEDQIVIIDEPELSLSVPWQKRFLNDILESKRCSMLVAVTHSPFIYDEYLREATVDLRRLTETRKA